MIYNIAILDDVGNAVGGALRTVAGWIIAQIYTLIEYLYKVFDYVSMAEILDNEFIRKIYYKVGMILGIFMIFKLIFSLVNSLISPEKLDDKKNGPSAIIMRVIVAIVLLGITPTLFNEAFELQRALVGNTTGNNVLYKLISDKPSNNNADVGHILAADLYLSFYTDEDDPHLNNGTIDTIYDTDDEYYDRFKDDNYDTIYDNLRAGNITFTDTIEYLTIKGTGNTNYVIEFNWFPLLIVGLLVLWIIAMYCIQVGIRVVQLAYLQLIAPIPILSYISDPEGAFKKWIKQCTTTYLDLFFRLAIIYFVMTMVSDILDQFNKMSGVIMDSTGMSGENWFTIALVKVIIILGLLLFAKKAPELIKDLFPNMGGGAGKFSFGLNPKKEIIDPIKASPITKAAATLTKPVGTLARKTIGGIDSARAGYGFSEGWKKNRGAFGTWINKQQEKYTPYSYEQKKNSASGAKEVKEIDNKWNSGVDIAKKLMKERGLTAAGSGATGWDQALKGTDRANYEAIFKHNEFVTSKMNLDKAKKDLDDLRDGLLQVQSGGSFVYGGVTYTSTNAADLSKKYNSKQGEVSGLESVHNSMRKQYADDARTEDTFKFIKNNASNPASPSHTHGTERI